MDDYIDIAQVIFLFTGVGGFIEIRGYKSNKCIRFKTWFEHGLNLNIL